MRPNNDVCVLLDKYSSVFNSKLGCYRYGKIKLELKPDAKPIFCRTRPVPLAYKKKIEEELDRLEKEGIITPVGNNIWATPLVPVQKNDQSIRLCGDYKTTINKHLQEVKYPLPRPEEIFAKLNGGQQFSKIDLCQAYTQFELEEESKMLLTWSTHKGLYKVERMMYGITVASGIFQRNIEQLFTGMENVTNYLDDILVTGKTREEHLETLEKVLRKLEDANLTVKKEKCEFFKDSIEYLGHHISKEGLRKTEKKVRAITDAPRPTNKTEVRCLVGMVNYYAKFIPKLAQILKPIYNLLKDNVTNGLRNARNRSSKSKRKFRKILH